MTLSDVIDATITSDNVIFSYLKPVFEETNLDNTKIGSLSVI